jgi:hypothetical protein
MFLTTACLFLTRDYPFTLGERHGRQLETEPEAPALNTEVLLQKDEADDEEDKDFATPAVKVEVKPVSWPPFLNTIYGVILPHVQVVLRIWNQLFPVECGSGCRYRSKSSS